MSKEVKSIVRNLTQREYYIQTKREDRLGTMIPPKGTIRLEDDSIIELCQAQYQPFVGLGFGSHADLFIENEEIRNDMYFEDKEVGKEQIVLTNENIEKIFSANNMDEFKELLKKYVVTRSEKQTIIKEASVRSINDYNKIRELESYTGRSVSNPDQIILP